MGGPLRRRDHRHRPDADHLPAAAAVHLQRAVCRGDKVTITPEPAGQAGRPRRRDLFAL